MFPESSFQSEVNVTSLALPYDCLSYGYCWLEVSRNLDWKRKHQRRAMVLFPVFLGVVQWNIIHQWIRRCSSMCVSPPNSQWEFRSTLLQRTNFLNCVPIVFISASYQNSSMKPSKSAVTYIGLSLYLDNSI